MALPDSHCSLWFFVFIQAFHLLTKRHLIYSSAAFLWFIGATGFHDRIKCWCAVGECAMRACHTTPCYNVAHGICSLSKRKVKNWDFCNGRRGGTPAWCWGAGILKTNVAFRSTLFMHLDCTQGQSWRTKSSVTESVLFQQRVFVTLPLTMEAAGFCHTEPVQNEQGRKLSHTKTRHKQTVFIFYILFVEILLKT